MIPGCNIVRRNRYSSKIDSSKIDLPKIENRSMRLSIVVRRGRVGHGHRTEISFRHPAFSCRKA